MSIMNPQYGTISISGIVPVSKGDQGEKGETGEKGEKGDPGVRGEKGECGERGEKGETGEKGMKGEVGEKGERGERGERGEKGETGERGENGEVGEKRERGERGERGEPGVLNGDDIYTVRQVQVMLDPIEERDVTSKGYVDQKILSMYYDMNNLNGRFFPIDDRLEKLEKAIATRSV